MGDVAAPIAVPVTTIVPFNDPALLPACAVGCGALYDANGACVPTTQPATNTAGYTQCFCMHTAVSPFRTGVAGVCDGVCPDAVGMTSIMNWYQDICSAVNQDQGTGGGNGNNDDGNDDGDSGNNGDNTGGDTGETDGETGDTPGKVIEGQGGDWLSNHWQWVIMLVVLVVAIAGIWVGACIWRRRHVKKKDRQSTISQKQSGSGSRPSWGPGMTPGASESANGVNPPGVFMPNTEASAFEEEKPKKKRWLVRERT